MKIQSAGDENILKWFEEVISTDQPTTFIHMHVCMTRVFVSLILTGHAIGKF